MSFLLAAGEVAPSVELLLARAAENGVSETKLTNHLRLNSTTARWVMKLAPDAAADRIDLDGDDLAELVLRWARS
jgi:sRNA-binding protein